MERTEQSLEEEATVDLGSITAETKGGGFFGADITGQIMLAGLTDD